MPPASESAGEGEERHLDGRLASPDRRHLRGHASIHRQLWSFLRAITDHELDWRVHAHANTVRWIVPHLLAVEVWTADMLGVMTLPLLPVRENHVHHIAKHTYQIRLIRGTYARAHGTDKAAFDPW